MLQDKDQGKDYDTGDKAGHDTFGSHGFFYLHSALEMHYSLFRVFMRTFDVVVYSIEDSPLLDHQDREFLK